MRRRTSFGPMTGTGRRSVPRSSRETRLRKTWTFMPIILRTHGQAQKYTSMQREPAIMQPMSWDDLRVFLAVQRTGSHGAAARALRVDPTTVGRRVGALERELGVRLFARTPSGLDLTRDGKRLVP